MIEYCERMFSTADTRIHEGVITHICAEPDGHGEDVLHRCTCGMEYVPTQIPQKSQKESNQ